MDPERWSQVRELYERVADLPAAEREVRLDELCGSDDELRHEIESLLGAEGRAAGFLESPLDPAALRSEAVPWAPERIGPYRVLGEIGAGGMGTVYRAVREDFPKTVALKVVRASLDGELLRRRFRRERDILAGLEHPAIGRLHDGGTTDDGRPYLAMELVSGLPLLAHAERRGLGPRARVELFLEICAAVAFAHERGVVHRDLKPSNILVDESGHPKLLDFGVAKLLDTDADDGGGGEPTLTAAPLMTPEYASPEQVRGEPAGPASDVYSLGVVLYELLSGQRPYRLASRSARDVERVVCETDPERPSTAAARAPATGGAERGWRHLRGDLDAIVLKALRKDPRQRYPSVVALAEDLRRYLDGLPIIARRDTWHYRVAKGLRRHRATVAMLILGVLAVGVGYGIARWLGAVAPAAAGPVARPQTVAVLGFTNLSGQADQEWIAAALTEALRPELAATGELRAVPTDEVAQARTDLELHSVADLRSPTLALLHRRLGSDLVVLGSYLGGPAADAPLTVVVRAERLPGGETIAEVSERATVSELLQLVGRAGFELRSRLGLTALSPAQAQQLVASRPGDAEAARLYAEGVRSFHEFESAKAHSLLERAIARSPDFAPAHLELAAVLMRQGLTAQGTAEAQRAAQLSRSLPRREQLLIAGRRAQWSSDWQSAIAAFRELLQRAPNDLEAGLGLGLAQISARRFADARVTLAALRKMPPPLVDDPRIDLLEARLARGTTAGELAAQRATAKAQALSANRLLARARFAEAAQLWDSPQISRAVPGFAAALRLAAAAGDRQQEGGARIQLGMARWRAGAVAAGEADVARVLREVPAAELPSLRRDALDFLGAMLLHRLELAGSERWEREALDLGRLLQEEDTQHYHAALLGVIDYLRGNPPAGRRRLEAAHRGLSRLEAEFYREDVALAFGWLLLETGDLDGATRLA
ncbi:MAG TPA: protein kinase, partial [Thermoanaerobaculia bacterium]|nr:protein kinase [Thermoanaerobaculia bacterium]